MIASSYDKCIKTAFLPAQDLLEAGNVKGFEGTLLYHVLLGLKAVPFSVALDNGLKLYWLGGLS